MPLWQAAKASTKVKAKVALTATNPTLLISAADTR
jgi:hypothetical protein